MAHKNLEVDVSDDINTLEVLHKYKKWFNGAKKFFSIKPDPPGYNLVKGEWIKTDDIKPSKPVSTKHV